MFTTFGVGNVSKAAATRTVTIKGVPTLVTDFDVAFNEGFGDRRISRFVRVSIWREQGAKLAQHLYVGREVAISGIIGAQGWVDKQGKPQATLTMSNPRLELRGKNAAGDTVTENVDLDGTATELTGDEVPMPY